MIRDSPHGFESSWLNFLLYEPFHGKVKTQRKMSTDVYLRSVSQKNFLIILIYEHSEHWIMLMLN